MSEQGLSPQRRELINNQERAYELVDCLHEERLEGELALTHEGRAVAEAAEETVRITIERAIKLVKYPSPLEVDAEEEEEDVIEMVSAMIIADAAAITSAQAAALAEMSSSHVLKARACVLQANQRLDTVRAAIHKRKLLEGDAENALKAALREATQARTLLTDAEAAEKRALNAAINAEADAKMTENLAFTIGNRDEKLRD